MGRGKLTFKGDASRKKKSKKNKHTLPQHVAATPVAAESGHNTLPPLVVPKAATVAKSSSIDSSGRTELSSSNPQVPKMVPGSGRITTSGTVVTGHETRFEKELAQGDAVIVQRNDCNPEQPQEMRVVTMRLSNTSCAFSSALSSNLKMPTPYFILRKPRDQAKEQRQKLERTIQEKKEEEQLAFGTYGTSKEFIYREKTENGSYRVRREEVDELTTRGDLLNKRTQKKSDKYC